MKWLLTRQSNKKQRTCYGFAKSSLLLGLASRLWSSSFGLLSLRFRCASLAHFVSYLTVGLILSLALLPSLCADEFPQGYFIDNDPLELQNQETLLPQDKRRLREKEVLVPEARGLVLVGKYDLISSENTHDVYGLKVIGLNVPGGDLNLARHLKPFYLGKPLRRKDIFEIKRQIILWFQTGHRPLVTVQVPEQEVTNGVLQLVVIESRLEKVDAKGARWFSNERLSNKLRVKEGKPIDEDILLKDLEWINQNPFHRSDVIYSPGKTPDTTVLELVTKDRFPLRVYAGAENTGLSAIGIDRYFGGFNWGNVWGLDQQLTYQYTASENFHKFQAHTVHYVAPLPWRHRFAVFGGYGKVYPHISNEGIVGADGHFRSRGMSIQASGRYSIPLIPLDNLLHEFTFGFDFKRTNTTVEFSEIPVVGKLANLTQFLLEYSLGAEWKITKTSFIIDLFFSPFIWVADQTKNDYNTLRPGATPKYVYGRAILSEIIRLPKQTSLVFNIRGQLSSKPLLPSEQFGLGGYDTVRGYKERIIDGDNAIYVSTEFRSPVLNLFWHQKPHKNFHDTLQFLAFFDFGYASNLRRPPGQEKREAIYAAGPGFRYQIGHYLSTRADWGIKLHRIEDDRSWSRVHFSFELSY